MAQASLALMWHRRDLRLHDNAALHAASQAYEQILAVFCIDPDILARPDTAAVRVLFMLESLAELQDSYAKIGGRLIIRNGDPTQVLPQLAAELNAAAVVWNEDVEPYAIERDRRVTEALAEVSVAAQSYQDMLLNEPEAIATQAGKPYSVYSPFWKNWSKKPKLEPFPTPEQLRSPKVISDPLPSASDLNISNDVIWPEVGEACALDLLDSFWSSGRLFDYDPQRNFPAEEMGTSRLSPHLRWGTIGIRQVWQATVDAEPEIRSDEAEASLITWRKELCWREFYKHNLYHWPHLETQSFRKDFDRFEWDQDQERFEAWCRGETGYTIVDAAMRQLNQTGWMHNRCRMIVASFLTKDLLLDWRWGEQYFMQKLVDGDLAANNGGWQWSASVGTDPKPMRIFNPSTQAKRYDAEAEYIRRYLPELASFDLPELLDVNRLKERQRLGVGYPLPLVDHKLQQQEFKRRYKLCRG